MASGSGDRQTRHHTDHGVPARPPTASTPLWTHLLRTNTSSEIPGSLSDMQIIAPPMAPLDKNATSMRVLLHDTQANFEKFTTHVGSLLENITETKSELKGIHSLFEKEREGLMGDVIDLVNRSQKEIQKCVGQPCQVSSIETQFKDVNHRLEGLDQRLDALHTLSQTHSQALQTQIQAVQMLLDKQSTILTAVLPLLPLLQAMPLRIETAKAAVLERITELPTKRQTSFLPFSSPGPASGKRRRADGDGRSPSPPSHPHKKFRPVENTADLPSSDTLSINRLSSVALGPVSAISGLTSSSPHAGDRSSPTLFVAANSIKSAMVPAETAPKPALTTPRRPLGDLNIQNQRSATNLIRTPSLLTSGRKHRETSKSVLSRSSAKPLVTPSRISSSAIFGQRSATHRLYAPSRSTASPTAPLPNVIGTTGARFSPANTSGTGLYARSGSHLASMSSPMHHPTTTSKPHEPTTPQVVLGITPTAARPPRMLRMHTSIQGGGNAGHRDLTITTTGSANVIACALSTEDASGAPFRPTSRLSRPMSPYSSSTRLSAPDLAGSSSSAVAVDTSGKHVPAPPASINRLMPPPSPPAATASSGPGRYIPGTSINGARTDHSETLPSAEQCRFDGLQQGLPAQRQSTRIRGSVAPSSRPASSMALRSQASGHILLPSRATGLPNRARTPAIANFAAMGKGKEVLVPKDGRRFIPLIDTDDEDDGTDE